MTRDEVIIAVCGVCGIAPEALKKSSRAEPLPTARAMIAHFLYRELRMNPQEIFPVICSPGYARTLIYHYVGRKTLIEARVPFQKDLESKVEEVKRRLEENSK